MYDFASPNDRDDRVQEPSPDLRGPASAHTESLFHYESGRLQRLHLMFQDHEGSIETNSSRRTNADPVPRSILRRTDSGGPGQTIVKRVSFLDASSNAGALGPGERIVNPARLHVPRLMFDGRPTEVAPMFLDPYRHFSSPGQDRIRTATDEDTKERWTCSFYDQQGWCKYGDCCKFRHGGSETHRLSYCSVPSGVAGPGQVLPAFQADTSQTAQPELGTTTPTRKCGWSHKAFLEHAARAKNCTLFSSSTAATIFQAHSGVDGLLLQDIEVRFLDSGH